MLDSYFFNCSQEWWHSVCVNRSSSCCGGKNQHWNVFLLTIDLSTGWWMERINALCGVCVCVWVCVCMFMCLQMKYCELNRGRTRRREMEEEEEEQKRGRGRGGGGVLTVNAPSGEPIKHWDRRGFKSHSQPTEIKRARWSLQITAGRHASVNLCVCVILRLCTCTFSSHSLNMQTSPCCPLGQLTQLVLSEPPKLSRSHSTFEH